LATVTRVVSSPSWTRDPAPLQFVHTNGLRFAT